MSKYDGCQLDNRSRSLKIEQTISYIGVTPRWLLDTRAEDTKAEDTESNHMAHFNMDTCVLRPRVRSPSFVMILNVRPLLITLKQLCTLMEL